ncbi:hypothetical protein TNCT_409501 [Trichonephila clavata]|uniref:Uncharacterized protein n=1 Tax=Trichonephila clavata TaxID=2740835 RepID=A0A8X6HQD1_TRICU|nr:hypothetical protein TNCT_409501 [Trichonephila clavata]
MEDIVIPSNDAEPLVETNTPSVYDGKASRPAYPGSCITYFLRFTCFTEDMLLMMDLSVQGNRGCGIKGRRDTPRVIGGKEALPGEWCW